MIPNPPPLPAEAAREDARREAAGQTSPALDVADEMAGAALDGTLEAVGGIAGAALEGTLTAAKVSLEVIGGILGGLADL